MGLAQAAIFLAAAVVAVPLFTRLGLGAVLGYLAAGVIIGPSGLGIVDGVEATLHFAEFGVVLLLFLIGLELQPARLWRMRGDVFGLGGCQVIVTTLVFAVPGWALGLPAAAAVVVGFGLSLSSTALALQVLAERNELATPHGRAAFGILLFQDLAAIPALAVIPLLGSEAVTHAASPLARGLVAAGVIAGLVLVGRLFLRPVFRIVTSSHSHEVSSALALLVVVGTGYVMQAAGLSMALGAFLAGVLLADSEYRHEVEANIEPFKGLLLGLFFMAVGMSAHVQLVREQPAIVLGLAAALVLVKLAVLIVLGRWWGLSQRAAVGLGLALAQGGEFAFVIYGVAQDAWVLSQPAAQVLIVVTTLSMAFTPLALAGLDVIRRRRGRGAEVRPFDAPPDRDGHVIVAGFGRFGQIVSRILRTKAIPFTALEVSPQQIDFVRRFGNEIYYGDASRVDLLRAAHADRARLFVLAIDDPEASVRTAKVVRQHFPGLRIVGRARNRDHAHALMALGVEHVVRDTFFSSLEATRYALEELGLSPPEARAAIRRFRALDEQFLLEQLPLRGDDAKLVASALHYNQQLERLFEEDAEAAAS
jgi:monovalent cation:proton antiporter-2 (CPA2) family protein